MERICGFLMLVSYLLISSTHTEGFEIRLAGYGSTRCSGRVEIFHNNSWGTVCDDDWDIQDVKVVCRQLGCGAAVRATKSAHFGLGTGRIWLDEVNCLGREKSLADCKHRKTGKHNCRHNEDAGVVCASVRLSGSTKCSGRVEVYYNNSWGTVCDDRWDLSDAMVVCRQLGCGMARGAALSALFGEGDKVIWLDEVNCSGNENSLTECQHKGFGEHDCSNSEDAGVVCSDSLPKPSISVDPGAEVKLGQNVSITCSNSAVLSGGTYILKKTSLYSVTDRLTSSSGTFRIPNVDFDDGGSYQCHYEKTISNQTFTTIPSDVVMLYMTGILPMPEISMDPANDVTLGQDVIISCATTTHIQQLGGLFSLVKTSDSVFEQEISTSNSTTFTIAKVTFDDEGRYQCVYKIGQSVSPPSNFCTLTITAPQSVAVFRIATAVLLLLLLLLVVVCLISWRKRRKTKQSGGLILSQLSTTAKNKCEDDKDHSYMNLDQRMINDELRDKGSGAEGKDTDVYEWPDEDHDYDEVGRDKNLINVSVGIENNRKDEKEDNPYIDLTLDKLDIY